MLFNAIIWIAMQYPLLWVTEMTWIFSFYYFSVVMTTQTVPSEYTQRQKNKKGLTHLQYFLQQSNENIVHTQAKPWKV